jgi:peroxiredoxin Q/BCP
LLSDPTHETIEKYGAWRPKKFMGREYLGIIRKTVLINPAGEIVKEYEGMKLETHAQNIIQDIALF